MSANTYAICGDFLYIQMRILSNAYNMYTYYVANAISHAINLTEIG